MDFNPELRRNLWLNFTPHRLIAMPLVITAIMVLIYAIDDYGFKAVSQWSLAFIGLLTVIWGGRAATETVLSEIIDKTWDNQRMSALSPWAMTWGKLLGSTAYTWYGSLICTAVFLATATHSGIKHPYMMLLLVIISSLFAQALGLLASLSSVRKGGVVRNEEKTAYMFIGIATVITIMAYAFNGQLVSIRWFVYEISKLEFIIVSVAVFLSWILFGAYRLMREELQMRNTFLGWLAFVLFISFYSFGFFMNSSNIVNGNGHPFTVAFWGVYFLIGSVAYLMLFIEKKSPVIFRTLFKSIKNSDIKTMRELLPCWAVTVVVLAIFLAGYTVFSSREKYLMFASALLFLLRDTAIVLFLNFSKNNKRADMTAVVYITLLYIVMPGILTAINFREAAAFFWPDDSVSAFAAAFMEMIAAFTLLFMRWKRNYTSISGPLQQEG